MCLWKHGMVYFLCTLLQFTVCSIPPIPTLTTSSGRSHIVAPTIFTLSPPNYPDWGNLIPANVTKTRGGLIVSNSERVLELRKQIEEIEKAFSNGQKPELRTILGIAIESSDSARAVCLDKLPSSPAGRPTVPSKADFEVASCMALESSGLDLAVRAWHVMRNSSLPMSSDVIGHILETVKVVSGPKGPIAQGFDALTDMLRAGNPPKQHSVEMMLEACIEMASAKGALRKGIIILESAFKGGAVKASLDNCVVTSLSSATMRSLEYGLQFALIASSSDECLPLCDALLSACALVAGGGGCLLQSLHILNLGTKHGLSSSELAFGDVVHSAAMAAIRAPQIGFQVLKLCMQGNPHTRPTSASSSLLIEACANLAVGKGALQLGLGLVQRLNDTGLKPSSELLSRLIEACAFCGDPTGGLGLCLAALRRLVPSRVAISDTAALALLKALGRSAAECGALHHGERLVALARVSRVALERRACKTLLVACARAAGGGAPAGGGYMELSWKVVGLLERGGVPLPVEAYESLVQATMAAVGLGPGGGLLRLGLRLLNSTVDAGMPPSPGACKSMLEACAAAARREHQALKRSVDLLHRLRDNGLGPSCRRIFQGVLAACRASCDGGEGGLPQGVEVVQLLASRAAHIVESNECIEGLESLLAACDYVTRCRNYALVQGVRVIDLQRRCGLHDPAAARDFLLAASARVDAGGPPAQAAIVDLVRRHAPSLLHPPAGPPDSVAAAVQASTARGASAAGWVAGDLNRVKNGVRRGDRGEAARESRDDVLAAAEEDEEWDGRWSAEDESGGGGNGGGGGGNGGGGGEEPKTPQESIVRTFVAAADGRVPPTPTPALSANKMLSRVPRSPTRRHLAFGGPAASGDSRHGEELDEPRDLVLPPRAPLPPP